MTVASPGRSAVTPVNVSTRLLPTPVTARPPEADDTSRTVIWLGLRFAAASASTVVAAVPAALGLPLALGAGGWREADGVVDGFGDEDGDALWLAFALGDAAAAVVCAAALPGSTGTTGPGGSIVACASGRSPPPAMTRSSSATSASSTSTAANTNRG
ncbi:hypothetical protein GCM10009827_020280 [Dactylosporangium maewongense]|uniref:Uncharacterized protein n=1 Tax=Dactylosporangium maewongense TaxID=634393 RepID=A0ABP4KNL3_9ACTN